jgi:hypothetical protein
MSPQHHSHRSWTLRPTLATLLLAFVASAALVAACGGSTGGATDAGAAAPADTAPATPSPVPSPVLTAGPPPPGAVDVVREFWRTAGDARLSAGERTRAARSRLIAPGSPLARWDAAGVAGAKLVRVVTGPVLGAPPEGATTEFAALVWIEPATLSTPWGTTGVHEVFASVVRMSDGSWRMWDCGTGP